MKKDLILLVVLLLVLGCSSVYEDPDDSFAPRPENAKSDSYQIVRLGEERTSSGIRKNYLLEMIEAYRDKYKSIKVRSDFNSDYVGEHSYEKYLKNVQAFKDSDLDAAEEYIKSFPDSLKFTSIGLDGGKYDIGDINWRSKSRKLRISDFYAQRYTDDWSAYAFIINLIPTSRYGYAKLEFTVNGEVLSFRKKAQRKIWRILPEYFWVHIQYYTFESSNGEAPLLISISDPNDHGDMNGIYLVMPKNGVFADSSAIKEMRASEEKAKSDPNYIPPPKLDYGSYLMINKDNIVGAEYIYDKRSKGASRKEVFDLIRANWKTIGKDLNEGVVLDLYTRDPELFRQRIEEIRRVVPRIEPKTKVVVEAGPWSIINNENFPIADIVYGEMSRRRTAEQTLETFRKSFKWAKDESLILKFTELYKKDSKKYKSLLLPLRKK